MGKKANDYILLPRKSVEELIRNYVVANNAVLMFSYLAEKKRLEIHMDTDEMCRLLDIKRSQLESAGRRGGIKSFNLGGVRFYDAFDVAVVAERIHRPKRLRAIAKLPSASAPVPTPKDKRSQ